MKNINAILLIILTTISHSALSKTAGKIIYSTGETHAYNMDNEFRSIKQGDPIYEKDTLATQNGRMQILFSDGGFLSLSKNTKYRIDRFQYTSKDNKNDIGFFTLLKGAIRQATGFIGKRYNKSFKVRTVAATIGIRGTGFYTKLCQSDCFDENGQPLADGQYVKNETGVITFSNNAGELTLSQGQAAFVEDSDHRPVQKKETSFEAHEINENIETFGTNQMPLEDSSNQVASTPPVTELMFTVNSDITGRFIVNTDELDDVQASATTGTTSFINTTASGQTTNSFDSATSTTGEIFTNSLYNVQSTRRQGAFAYNDDSNNIIGNDIHIITSDQQIMNSLPTNSTGTYTTLLGGTNPTFIRGSNNSIVGTLLQTNTSISLDFSSGSVLQARFLLDFGSAGILDINDSGPSNISSAAIPVDASCSTTALCNGNLSGNTNFAVLGDGTGVMGVFLLNGDTDASVSGSYLLGGSIQ
jgi:hypothetical protein